MNQNRLEGGTVSEPAPPCEPVTMGQAPTAALDHGPVRVPGYEVLGELGRGGMGVVYKARQVGLDRVVALKMVLAGAHASPADLARFRVEAEAIARLAHPGIVRVYEVGEHEGRPYFSMEYCPGGSLEAKLRGTPLPAAEAAALVESLAQAMHAAHQVNVVHRDLKPANVLLVGQAFQPDSSADVRLESLTYKITDFGLARKLDEQSQTQTGSVLGTPSYMAPEQASGSKEVGPTADVYALGTILYECLTGRPPFKAATPLDTILQVVADEPVPPTRVQSATPRDLETICLKCLEKDPARRYASAQALADDLRRYLDGEPIHARPVGAAERLWKWARRRPTVAALLSAIVAVTAVGFALVSWKWHEADQARAAEAEQRAEAEGERQQADDARKQAQAALARTEEALYISRVSLARVAWQADRLGEAEAHLDACPERLRQWEWRFLKGLCRPEQFSVAGQLPPAALSPDGRQLASVARDERGNARIVRVVTAAEGRELFRLGHKYPVTDLAYNPDGALLAVATRRDSNNERQGEVKVWGARNGKALVERESGDAYALAVAFHPERDELAALHLGRKQAVIEVLAARSGEPRRTFPLEYRGFHPVDNARMRYSHDGTRLLIDASISVSVIDSAGGKVVFEADRRLVWLTDARAISPDGTRYAAADPDTHRVRIHEVGTNRLLDTLDFAGTRVRAAEFSPDGQRLAVAAGPRIHVRDVAGGWRFTLRNPGGTVSWLRHSPDGRSLLAFGEDDVLRAFDATGGGDQPAVTAPDGVVTGPVAFARQGRLLAVAHVPAKWADKGKPLPPSTVRLTDRAAGAKVEAFRLENKRGPRPVLALSPDGATLAALLPGPEPTLQLWDTRTGRARTWQGPPRAGEGQVPTGLPRPLLTFSPDGRCLAVWDGIWDVSDGKKRFALVAADAAPGTTTLHVAFAPDGRRLAAALSRLHPRSERSPGSVCRLWDISSSRPVAGGRDFDEVRATAFHPDGRRLAALRWTGRQGLAVEMVDIASGQTLFAKKAHPGRDGRLAFSHDGTRLGTAAGKDETTSEMKLWEAETGHELLTLSDLPPGPVGLQFGEADRELLIAFHPVLARQGRPTALAIPAPAARPPEPQRWRAHQAEAAAYHRVQAAALQGKGGWATVFHLNQLLREAPADDELLRRRAAALLGAEAWVQALADADRLLARQALAEADRAVAKMLAENEPDWVFLLLSHLLRREARQMINELAP